MKKAITTINNHMHNSSTGNTGGEEIEKDTFQTYVSEWLLKCFGEEISHDKVERNHRFLEEALELVQSTGCTQSEAEQLVDYVFNRPVGEPYQETGGVMVTLAALCYANGLDMQDCGAKELARVWTKIEKIRQKQAAKPKHSPLPQQQEEMVHQQEGAGDDLEKAYDKACEQLYPLDRKSFEKGYKAAFQSSQTQLQDKDKEIERLREERKVTNEDIIGLIESDLLTEYTQSEVNEMLCNARMKFSGKDITVQYDNGVIDFYKIEFKPFAKHIKSEKPH